MSHKDRARKSWWMLPCNPLSVPIQGSNGAVVHAADHKSAEIICNELNWLEDERARLIEELATDRKGGV